jgi:MFS superfamily sulfate permease-like transporter
VLVSRKTITGLREQGTSFAIARLTDDVRAQLDQYGLTDLVGAEHIYDTIDAALMALARGRVDG